MPSLKAVAASNSPMTNSSFSMKKRSILTTITLPCCSLISDQRNTLLEVHKILSFSTSDTILMKTIQNYAFHDLPHVEWALPLLIVSEEQCQPTYQTHDTRTCAVHAPFESLVITHGILATKEENVDSLIVCLWFPALQQPTALC